MNINKNLTPVSELKGWDKFNYYFDWFVSFVAITVMYYLAYSAFNEKTAINNINDLIKFNVYYFTNGWNIFFILFSILVPLFRVGERVKHKLISFLMFKKKKDFVDLSKQDKIIMLIKDLVEKANQSGTNIVFSIYDEQVFHIKDAFNKKVNHKKEHVYFVKGNQLLEMVILKEDEFLLLKEGIYNYYQSAEWRNEIKLNSKFRIEFPLLLSNGMNRIGIEALEKNKLNNWNEIKTYTIFNIKK